MIISDNEHSAHFSNVEGQKILEEIIQNEGEHDLVNHGKVHAIYERVNHDNLESEKHYQLAFNHEESLDWWNYHEWASEDESYDFIWGVGMKSPTGIPQPYRTGGIK